MKELKEIEIYLLSNNVLMVKAWEKAFTGVKGVEPVCSDFGVFMATRKVGAVVSPANAYGLMDGGYDQAITDWFGEKLQQDVRRYISDNFYGEQPVGTSFIIDTGKDGVKLIHTPTMRYPERIRDPLVIYTCMRTCLMCAMENDVESIVIPAFGALTGCVPAELVADMMKRAYDQLLNPPSYISWRYAKLVYIKY